MRIVILVSTRFQNVTDIMSLFLDFILFWRTRHSANVDFSTFMDKYPLFKHPASSGFITNFVCPKLWEKIDSPIIKSMLACSGVYYTIGCHPHFAHEMIGCQKLVMKRLIDSKIRHCIAIGECGLDTSKKNNCRMFDQIEVFKFQIRLALDYKKPLVLHIRGAEREALHVLQMLPHDWPIHRYFLNRSIISLQITTCFRHCWNDNWEVCQQWIDRFPNSVIGFTNLITYPNNWHLKNVVEKIPLTRIVIETDAPYFSPCGGGPDGMLGHNERQFTLPIHAANIAGQIAAIKKCKIKTVLTASQENVKRIYGTY